MGNRAASKDLGLEVVLVLTRYFLRSEHLHFGYWQEGEQPEFTALGRAQERYSQFILSHLPAETKRALDVGCGSGDLAQKLAGRGLEVDGVTPSPFLADLAGRSLGNGHEVYQTRYEDLVTDRRYDLIVFSESFQYLDLEVALEKTMELLEDGGYFMICDFFRILENGGPIKGGHPLVEFYDTVSSFPVTEVKNVDITPNTAPTLDLVDDMIKRIALPVRDVLATTLRERYPILTKLLQWRFRKKIEKWNRRYLSGAINGGAFIKSRSYRLLLYRKELSLS